MRGNRRFRPARISIHAPPRGATRVDDFSRLSACISIHAPPRGATHPARMQGIQHLPFQFTPLREGRQTCRSALVRFRRISIHAPPRGATSFLVKDRLGAELFQFTPLREGRPASAAHCPRPRNFNSRPSARGDTFAPDAITCKGKFQFTPLREGRPAAPRERAEARYFNSRPSARGDEKANGLGKEFLSISIHAPPRGATRIICRTCTGR